MRRRTFVATTAGLGTALVAGCSGGGGSGGGGSSDGGGGGGGSGGDNDTGGGDGDSTAIGFFQLLISDQPAAIEDFDSLKVSFEKARVFRGDRDQTNDDEEETATNQSATNQTTDSGGTEQPATETPPESEQEDENEQDRDDEGGEAGFREITLEGTTVDLTEVVGDKAIGIFDGELPAGTYTKIELHATDVEGIVDGEEVAVKIPSEKLQIVKPFEVTADENTSFVFDINVVKKGPNGYNLLPVISGSGVTGRDVEVEEVDSENDKEAETPPDDNTTSNGDSGNDI